LRGVVHPGAERERLRRAAAGGAPVLLALRDGGARHRRRRRRAEGRGHRLQPRHLRRVDPPASGARPHLPAARRGARARRLRRRRGAAAADRGRVELIMADYQQPRRLNAVSITLIFAALGAAYWFWRFFPAYFDGWTVDHILKEQAAAVYRTNRLVEP